MTWYDFLLNPKKKVTLHQCKKILGQGVFGISYLTPDNLVVKIEPYYDEIGKVGEDFAMNILPTLPYEVRKHFTQIYGIQILDYNPIPDLKCLEEGYKPFKLDNSHKYKVSIMEYGGVPINSIKLTNELRIQGFKELFNPVCAVLAMGYSHNDLHMGNITYDENKKTFRIIDYNIMSRIDLLNNSLDIYDTFKFNIERNLIILFENFLLNDIPSINEKEILKIIGDNVYEGPIKYLKYPKIIYYYETLINPEKYNNFLKVSFSELPKTFKILNIIKCLYYIYDYDFNDTKYGLNDKMTLNDYYQNNLSKGFYEISCEVSRLLNLL